jgi:tRNA(Ile)-lysidine synthase
MGLRFKSRRTDTGRLADASGLSLETAGREARRDFFTAMARRHRCGFLFTAHHADDQAETILHHLCRGASLTGFGGMTPSASTMGGVTTLRPLLGVTRAEIDRYAEAHALKFREDQSNTSRAHTRNRVRHELLPLMTGIFRRDVSPLLLRFSEQAARDDRYLQRLAREFAQRHALVEAGGSLRVTAALRNADPAIQSRVVFAWLAKRHRIPTGSREVEAALGMIRDAVPSVVNLPDGARLSGDARKLNIERVSEARRDSPARGAGLRGKA